ncbi:MAG: 3-oxoacyl-ACP reductase FabG [Clostridia bacterium]|nr:3-oxoacyl-ACP reductase FabG [Clostridia bacterium]MBQ3006973.1 3-oxoacyl-ACP reductase FabG [Clostridia bacterium]
MKKCAMITGASGGIGSAIALRLANDGFDIAACWHSDEAGIRELEEKLALTGVRFRTYKADVSDYGTIENVFADATDYFGGVSVLVNNAGIAQQKLFTDISPAEFDRINDINYKGVFNCCRCAVPFMVNRKSGKIINISSMWGVCGASCETVYSASKAAVIGLTKALARELAPSNIQVNCVAPGAIDTKMNNNLSNEEKEAFSQEIPMGRFGTPEEIAGVVSFLAGKDSDYVTAQVITADGGLT